jgi:tRNA(His) 5'-end guanylyltransferase
MLAQSEFSHKSLQGLSCDELQEKLWKEKGINWANLPQGQKIGFISVKKEIECTRWREIDNVINDLTNGNVNDAFMRSKWCIQESPATRTDLDVIIKSIDNIFCIAS